MPETMKVVIPLAGRGTRLIPLTLHKPKPLVHVAGRRLLDYVLEAFTPLSQVYEVEYVFIIGYHGDQIKDYMHEVYPDKKVNYAVQSEIRGQSHALWMAREYLSGAIVVAYSDTVIRADFSVIEQERDAGVIWVKEVEDPRSLGVVKVDENGYAVKIIEKPNTLENRLAVAGLYYFPEGATVIRAIEEQMAHTQPLNNEFYLADAVNIMLGYGLRMRTAQPEVWLDAGNPRLLLETNSRLLSEGGAVDSTGGHMHNSVLIPPLYIHRTARVDNCIIGPNVSVDADCRLERAIIANTIIDRNSLVYKCHLENSLIGENNHLSGKSITDSIIGNGSVLT